MSAPPLEFRADLGAARRDEIRRTTASHTTLEHVLRWSFGFDPPRPILNVVAQDEFTNDVVLRWDDDLVLVYDCT